MIDNDFTPALEAAAAKVRLNAAAPAMLAALEQISDFVAVMDESNWRDLRLHIERQCGVIAKATGHSP